MLQASTNDNHDGNDTIRSTLKAWVYPSVTTIVNGVQVIRPPFAPQTAQTPQSHLQLRPMPDFRTLLALRHIDDQTMINHYSSQASQMGEVELREAMHVLSIMRWALSDQV